MPPPDGVSRPAGRGTEPRGGEAGQSERRPGRGRLGPPTRRDPTRQGAAVRLVLTGEPSSRVRRFGDVRRCSRASHGLKTTARPRGPTATGTPWKRMDDGGKSVSRAPPRTTPGGRSQTSSSGWCVSCAGAGTASWWRCSSRHRVRPRTLASRGGAGGAGPAPAGCGGAPGRRRPQATGAPGTCVRIKTWAS